MRDNPYQPSFEPAHRISVAVDSGNGERLKKIALYQRRILSCILLHLVFVGLSSLVPTAQSYELVAITFVGLMLTWLAGVAFVFLLASNVYRRRVAVLLGLLACTPIFGLIVWLIVHIQANSTLKRNGLEVGFMGVDPSHI